MILESGMERTELFGNLDANLKIIEEYYGVQVVDRNNEINIIGGTAVNKEKAEKTIKELIDIIKSGEHPDSQKINYVITLVDKGISYKESNVGKDILCFTHMGKPLKPKTLGQKKYTDSIRKKEIVFGVGPAGTGKTYLAVAMAIQAYKNKQVQKIILARPAVEAGERLGFLPGDLQEKVDPYLRPLYDALYDILGKDTSMRLKEKEVIEVVPLAYMRGRTLDNAFIILDEAQNTTREQMKMFLTRMGFGSKVVVTGDVTQIDLPRGKRSGLLEAVDILNNLKDIDFCFLKDIDVVRHELVKKIINAYDAYYENNPQGEEE
ncbi:MAG: PhoH family protein [Eubacteriales bacterium]|nr:PhoH family protein [Eubacteriales bacterium]MDD4389928.1 PhoH family protein [Eubacteriales bacterium]